MEHVGSHRRIKNFLNSNITNEILPRKDVLEISESSGSLFKNQLSK